MASEVLDPSPEEGLTTEEMVAAMKAKLGAKKKAQQGKTVLVVPEKVDHPLKETVEEMIRDYTEGNSFDYLLKMNKSLSKQNEQLLRQLQTPVNYQTVVQSKQTGVKYKQPKVQSKQTPVQSLVEDTPEEKQQTADKNAIEISKRNAENTQKELELIRSSRIGEGKGTSLSMKSPGKKRKKSLKPYESILKYDVSFDFMYLLEGSIILQEIFVTITKIFRWFVFLDPRIYQMFHLNEYVAIKEGYINKESLQITTYNSKNPPAERKYYYKFEKLFDLNFSSGIKESTEVNQEDYNKLTQYADNILFNLLYQKLCGERAQEVDKVVLFDEKDEAQKDDYQKIIVQCCRDNFDGIFGFVAAARNEATSMELPLLDEVIKVFDPDKSLDLKQRIKELCNDTIDNTLTPIVKAFKGFSINQGDLLVRDSIKRYGENQEIFLSRLSAVEPDAVVVEVDPYMVKNGIDSVFGIITTNTEGKCVVYYIEDKFINFIYPEGQEIITIEDVLQNCFNLYQSLFLDTLEAIDKYMVELGDDDGKIKFIEMIITILETSLSDETKNTIFDEKLMNERGILTNFKRNMSRIGNYTENYLVDIKEVGRGFEILKKLVEEKYPDELQQLQQLTEQAEIEQQRLEEQAQAQEIEQSQTDDDYVTLLDLALSRGITNNNFLGPLLTTKDLPTIYNKLKTSDMFSKRQELIEKLLKFQPKPDMTHTLVQNIQTISIIMLFDVVNQLSQDSKLKRKFIRSLNDRAKQLYDTYDLDRRLIFQFNTGGVSLRDGWVKDDKPWQDTSPFTVLEYSNQRLDVRQCILSNGTYEYLRLEGGRLLGVPEVDQLLLENIKDIKGVDQGDIDKRNKSIETPKPVEIVGGYRLKKKHRRRKTQNKRKHSRKTRNTYSRKTRNKYIRKTRNKYTRKTKNKYTRKTRNKQSKNTRKTKIN